MLELDWIIVEGSGELVGDDYVMGGEIWLENLFIVFCCLFWELVCMIVFWFESNEE